MAALRLPFLKACWADVTPDKMNMKINNAAQNWICCLEIVMFETSPIQKSVNR